MDPTFARAHAGLSFTHFQNAFLLRPQDRQQEAERALDTAGLSLAADERDPTAHWAMGRALWLAGGDIEAVSELRTSVALSPSFTLGHYALAFVNSQSGDAEAAITASDHARELSPFDLLLFGMLGARAMALFRLGAFEEAAEAAVSAASRPNAHVHRLLIAHRFEATLLDWIIFRPSLGAADPERRCRDGLQGASAQGQVGPPMRCVEISAPIEIAIDMTLCQRVR